MATRPQFFLRGFDVTVIAVSSFFAASSVNTMFASMLMPMPGDAETSRTVGKGSADKQNLTERKKPLALSSGLFGEPYNAEEDRALLGGGVPTGREVAVEEPDEAEEEAEDLGPARKKCAPADLKFTLMGTIFSPVPSQAMATLKPDGSDDTVALWVGDTLKAEGKDWVVRGVELDRVEFSQGGRRVCVAFDKESLEPDAGDEVAEDMTGEPTDELLAKYKGRARERAQVWAGKIKCDGSNKCQMDADFVGQSLSNLDTILRHARLRPFTAADGTQGFKFDRVWEGGVFEGMGFRQGDVLMSVNGDKVNSIDKAMQMFSTLKDNRSFNIDVQRNGKPTQLSYEVR